MSLIETDRIQQLSQVMQRIHRSNQNLKVLTGIAHSEFIILQHINCASMSGRQITLTEISEAIQLTKAAVSQVISALEAKGLVQRSPSFSDRRIVHVTLTEEGLLALQHIRGVLSERLITILSKMGDEDAEAFMRLLDKFSRIMSEV